LAIQNENDHIIFPSVFIALNSMTVEKNIFIQRIPDEIYAKAVDILAKKYHFLNGIENGGKMRLANYFVGVHSRLAEKFIAFIHHVIEQSQNAALSQVIVPEGFESAFENLTDFEKTGKFSFASFDMAVTENGLKNIEFQAIATYPFTAVQVNSFIQQALNLKNSTIFAHDKQATWQDFKTLYQTIMGGQNPAPIVLTDRNVPLQKTNFEFYATQTELDLPVEIVDIQDIFEKDHRLFYKTAHHKIEKIARLYNRVLPSEAIYEDHYPFSEKWRFRYDKPYKNLKFINHPRKLFEVSKRLLPYIQHPFNPPAVELATAASQFLNGALNYRDYVWKHKNGAAGFNLILSPTADILKKLASENCLSNYIAQQKVNYKIFKTDDNLEKVIELRFMTAHSENSINIVPLARIGHYTTDVQGNKIYKIHFGDNNRLGYGLAPVLIFEDGCNFSP